MQLRSANISHSVSRGAACSGTKTCVINHQRQTASTIFKTNIVSVEGQSPVNSQFESQANFVYHKLDESESFPAANVFLLSDHSRKAHAR